MNHPRSLRSEILFRYERTIASTSRTQTTWGLIDKTCMILEVNAKPVTRPAKGARVYKILVTGEMKPIYAHESDLKILRRRKLK